MSRPTSLDQVWLPIHASDQNVITSAVLIERPLSDHVTLYVFGNEAARIEVPAGSGARLLGECGLERAL
jgi:hypothetical protein